MNWNEILKFFISVGSITACIIYIGKKVVDKSLEAGVESYKSNLNKELESFKSTLARMETEHKVKYSKLYEQRADKIKQLYTALYELEQKLKFLTSAFQGPEWATNTEREDAVRSHIFEIEEIIELNRIYFADEVCNQMRNILINSKSVLLEIFEAKQVEKHNDSLIKTNRFDKVDNPNEPLDAWMKADSFVQNEINIARLELANEFRKMIGVN